MPEQQIGDLAQDDLELRFPDAEEDVEQDEEWCEVEVDGETRRIRFHDYDEIYKVPGLYERLFYDELECQSPHEVSQLLEAQLERAEQRMADLRVLDVGAGNGMVGEELKQRGGGQLVGVDIIPEAKMATERDRPGTYVDYQVVDLTELPDDVRAGFEQHDFNCLVTVAALGFGDIPPRAFAEAFNLVSDEGWVAFNIKEEFLTSGEDSGFAGMTRRMFDEGVMRLCAQQRYPHRLSTTGEPLDYVAIVARKQQDLPLDWTS